MIESVKVVVVGRETPLFYDRRDVIAKKLVMEMVLGGLDKESSKRLLTKRNIEESEHERLYDLTRGHPLLLELVTPTTTAEAKKFLRDEIYVGLNDREKTVLGLASVFRYPFYPRAILVKDIDYDTIDNLVEWSLLQRSADIYDLHDTLREFFYNRLTAKQKTDYHSIAAEYYQKEKGDSAIIESMYHLINANNHEKASKLAVENGERLIDKGFGKEFMSILECFYETEVKKNDWVKILLFKGDICMRFGEWDKSLNYAKDVLGLAEKLGYKKQIAESCIDIGRIYMQKTKCNKALENLQNALKISKEINDAHGMSEAHFWIGKVSWYIGKLDDAKKHLKTCFDLAMEIGATSLVGKAIMDIGFIHSLRGEYKESIEHMMRSLSI
ncbi:MAG: hypothetical protein AB1485_09620, partial [Candidatus Thermoplasmatota archaeon]